MYEIGKNLKQYTNRIAWMYWKEKISQKEIAKKFNINTVQVHRILSEAEKNGSVKVFVEGSFDICKKYEEDIKEKYNLKHIEVVPSEHTFGKKTTASTLDPDPLSIAYAGANTILNKIKEEKCRNFGWSTGSTNTRIANLLPEIRENVSFIDTTGSLRNDLSFNPLLGLNTLSKKTRGKCYHLGAPYIFPSLKESRPTSFDIAFSISISIEKVYKSIIIILRLSFDVSLLNCAMYFDINLLASTTLGRAVNSILLFK